MRYDGPDPSGPLGHPRPGVPASGRHRRGGPVRRRALPRPGFRGAVLATGTAAAALTVLLGLYAATPPSSPAPRAATPPVPQAPPPTPQPPAPASPQARAGAPEDTPAHRGDGTGAAAEGLAPQTGAVLSAPVTVSARTAQYVRDVIALVNAERNRAGCGPLRTEARLARAAQAHADDMAARDYYAHDNPEGRDGGDRISAAGYSWRAWGENIHRGPKTPERAMQGWMASPAHRANILNCAFHDIGAGVALTADGPWWVQDFGTKG
ncbi:CAP domain-containing protein [Streptomyces sp. CC208A]|uniref:CAP domain-containing protein n=1 Tax=Streptomyces sp. CC208A TaxID=3044573 RepID=UPI0024A92535|nr:CAP domain-containing protein [Streptomyces sp. CC208A]